MKFRTLLAKPGHIVLANGCEAEINIFVFDVTMGPPVGGYPDFNILINGLLSKLQCPQEVINEVSKWQVLMGGIIESEPWDLIPIKGADAAELIVEIRINDLKLQVRVTATPYLATILRVIRCPIINP
ncbi:hypothetical protein [Vulcanisaeta sp. JCM 16159]|uniref:hypothetical protein n=1 Tax=Vulcanisaeta sp. JCM 16159 TaxID=1295371 RepID=UPI0006D21EEE|nr:hypothetical protein [Vulcanisaeta sp. JCM 16159]